MKKYLFILLAFFMVSVSLAQVAVSKNDMGRLAEFDKERFDKFKSTKTIFILSNIYDKEKYVQILNEVWNVTPYEVVSANDFDYANYLTDEFSFAHLQVNIGLSSTIGFHIEAYINFYYLDLDEINKKIAKVKNDQDKFISLVFENYKNIGRINLLCDAQLIKLADKNNGSGGGFAWKMKDPSIKTYGKLTKNQKLKEYHKSMIELVYDKQMFKNYSLGYLKNNLQEVNRLIVENQFVWLFEDFSNIKVLKSLKNSILYVPEIVKIDYNPRKIEETDLSSDDVKKLMSKYKYKYDFISQSDLDTKILANEDFYYLRYSRENAGIFVHVVNGKTGQVIYKDYVPVRYNMKDKDFENLTKAVLK